MAKNHNKDNINCDNPTASLVEMFVNQIQQGRIDQGQCPARRPVFLKPHGVVKGVFKVRPDLPEHLRIGLFAGDEYALWARFSSDTLPGYSDFKTTCGVGLKLFDTPTPKIFGLPEEKTFDFIMQNFPVFFVDTAKDMCEFTRAGVVNRNYQPYLDSHPDTARILDEMARPVGSALAIAYWGILPFSLGDNQYVKYMLKPRLNDAPPSQQPANPTYLAQEMSARLATEDVYFDFCVQLRTDPDAMPLDQAMVEWPESESPFIPIAEVRFPKQDINARGQAEYGENLSFNIWRVTEEHRPQGSIAEARRDVYAASAQQRRNANGVPDGEPVSSRPDQVIPPCKDDVIVRAAIHPGIGVARVGNAETAYFIGPEVTEPAPEANGFYRTPENSLKRQAARFRIYGYNAAGEVVSELTSENANITWQVHVANDKADWFHFIQAMDIPESRDLVVERRNEEIKGEARKELVIDPGVREISGISSHGPEYRFDSGTFKGQKVYLGELQTDESGRLIFLGGHGKSASPSHQPPFLEDDPDSFNNAPDWYDDMSDGPVNATVAINGRNIPVEGAWVITAPPNYAPELTSWRTMYDLMVDVYTQNGWFAVPDTTLFTRDVLPFLKRFSNLQWVNQGFAAMFGKGRPMDFSNPEFIARLAQTPKRVVSPLSGEPAVIDPYGELRRQILNTFRPFQPGFNDPRLWPWLYGDDFNGDLQGGSPNTMLALPSLQQMHLQRWADGHFDNDWKPGFEPARTLSEVPLEEQPEMLDRAAMTFCLADAFHPGCELTWPMRHASLYRKPFRIRQSTVPELPDQWGATLNQEQVLAPDGPLYAQVAGGLTRWMGLPWQGDTAFCRSGYDPDYDLYLPSFWPARVPNTVLTEAAYMLVMDTSQPRDIRLAAYNQRASWNRFVDQKLENGKDPDTAEVMERMVAEFSAQGIVEARPGIKDDPDFPEVIYVENSAYKEDLNQLKQTLQLQAGAPATGRALSREDKLRQAGWASEQQWRNAVRLRQRKRKRRKD
ncbi:LodA/GoxA family CTQ-dependent oxidase [Salinisphaera sp. G21_0]|uniref:LodA/GoxA family CTQ-dependent oxidase n=1 Tax=Salinisphaera sp. G21_0 TaxID=2821094 RepID=UPI001ADC7FFF|nr:LodA/GoxA family CTQ-dependent oxidase [Salinisphaera sp. G21_0]MBO9479981.1 LodA/GoxA family CTQ-dependent oxidase [Salinisphaera sp. G21_0]